MSKTTLQNYCNFYEFCSKYMRFLRVKNHNNNNQIDHNSSIIISNHNKDNTNNNPISNSGHPNAILRHRDLAFHLIFIMAHHTGHHINYN